MKRDAFFVRRFFLVMVAVFSSAAFAQNTIRMQAAGGTVRLSDLSVDVEVMGNIAVTTLDMTFANETSRVLEGELEFPLGEGESIVGYALDINGTMRQGVVVDKDKGRQTFEAVVRQGIDPGLVEATGSNSFRTRVYPLPAHGTRRVQIVYQSVLQSQAEWQGEDKRFVRKYVYSALPPGTLDTFSFRLTVLATDAKPSAVYDDQTRTFSFGDMRSGYTGSISRTNYALARPLSFVIPAGQEAGGAVFTQDVGSDTFFYYSAPVFSPDAPKKLPRRLVVLYDISASAKKRDVDAEVALLKAYIQTCAPQSVTVSPFCNELHEAVLFSGEPGQIAGDVERFIRGQDFDGATNLNYDFAAMFGGDEVLLFTDGVSNWDDTFGTPALAAKRSNMPVLTTINSSASADHAWLLATARQNGGRYINLCTTTQECALELLRGTEFRVVGVDYDGTAVTDVFPAVGDAVTGDLCVTGILKRKSAAITLRLGHGNTTEVSVTLNASAVEGTQSQHVARQWAITKINALGMDYQAHKEQIVTLAKKFGIVTQDTSLIVLDSVQDYIRYGIVPPQELRAEYDRLTASSGTAKPVDTPQGNVIPQGVYTLFAEFRAWWNTTREEFRKKKNPQKPTPREPVSPNPPVVIMESADAHVDILAAPDAVYEESYAMAAAPEAVYDDANIIVAEEMLGMEVQSAGRALTRSAAASADGLVAESPAGNASGASGSAGNSTGQKIQLQAWSANAEYLSILKRTPTERMYSAYLDMVAQYERSPSFYMEVSDYFAAEGLDWQSLRILSNLAEMDIENSDVLRALGNKLVERGLYTLAVPVFEKLVAIRGEIPQFYRDLGLAYYYAGDTQRAVDTLYSVAYKTWDARFAQVQQIALNDMNAIIAAAKPGTVDTSAIDKALLQNFDVDVRVVLTWNTDDCDVDLWVTDGDGEKCYYGNKLTANGGRLSRDFTQGYGPEEFCIRYAPDGNLKIEANYFASHQQKLLQPVTVQAEVYTNFGRPGQTRKILTLQLDSVKQTFYIGDVLGKD